ncbi:MAG TPA: hypothetical protein VGM08_03785 [Candidatus Saccharimonadales bacterium]|jgi:hypothetical protein
MSKALSKRRLSENEVIFRDLNERVQKWRENVERIAKEDSALAPAFDVEKPLHFYCECSNANCRRRLRISLKDYNRIHQSRDTFTILCGHEIPAIEEVVEENAGYCVVRKQNPPQTADRLHY